MLKNSDLGPLVGTPTQGEDRGEYMPSAHGTASRKTPIGAAPAPVRVRVWDLPTRLFHWSLAAGVGLLVLTGKLGADLMVWHARIAYTVFALLLFRIVWGFVGGYWSRFRQFMPSPRTLVRHLRAPATAESAGHSPLGGLSILAFLLVLFLQIATGLFSDDQADFVGPLNAYVSNGLARLATRYHKQIGEPLVYVMVGLHLAAILVYRLRRRWKLTSAMWTGDKQLPPASPASRDDTRSRLLALTVFTACAGVVAALVVLAGHSQ
jgi:cytochrome b